MFQGQRALYNALRMNWQLDPTLEVEPWQVEDYRNLPLDAIFERLHDFDVSIDSVSFPILAEEHVTPEGLTEELLNELDCEASEQDQIYLLIFELWRRLVPEKLCLSIFCDELDHQIYHYDQGQLEDLESLEDILANLEVILDENVDQGISMERSFASLAMTCANDLESFLYDFIAEQIDQKNVPYASELLDAFSPYVTDGKWFEFLGARLLALTDPGAANAQIREIARKTARNPDLELYLEMLSTLVPGGEEDLFAKLVKKSVNLIDREEDFQDLLAICIDYSRCLDDDLAEKDLLDILNQRSKKALDAPLKTSDPHLKRVSKILAARASFLKKN